MVCDADYLWRNQKERREGRLGFGLTGVEVEETFQRSKSMRFSSS